MSGFTPPRTYVPADEPAYLAMLRRGGGNPWSPARMRWKYAHPQSDRFVIDGPAGMAAHTGFVGMPLQLRGTDTLCGLSADSFTAPEARRRGFFCDLVLHEGRVKQPAVLFAWLHGAWSGTEARAGWTKPARIEWRRTWLAPVRAGLDRLGLRGRRLAARVDARIWNPRAHDPALQAEPATPAALDEAWRHVEGRWPLTIRRDAAWFTWRAADPDRPCELGVARRHGSAVGAVAFRCEAGRYGRRGVIVDVNFAPDDPAVAQFLVDLALTRLAAAGAARVSALAVPGSAWDRALDRQGLAPAGVGHDFGVIPYADLPGDPHTWAISGAEGDSF